MSEVLKFSYFPPQFLTPVESLNTFDCFEFYMTAILSMQRDQRDENEVLCGLQTPYLGPQCAC